MKTFSSKWPCIPPTVIAASLPMTCAATWVTTSGMTGFTLPGMIEEPFWSSGRKISASPARGPEPIRRRSFAIFVYETDTTLSAADATFGGAGPRGGPAARRLRLERIGGRRDRHPGVAGELLAHARGELGMR